jgi:hypothetical protein
MAVKYTNNAEAIVAGNLTSTDTSITVDDASKFPTLAAGDLVYLTLSNISNTVHEIVICTDITGNVLTVTRGQDNTTALDWTAGDTKLSCRLTAGLLDLLLDQRALLEGDVVFDSVQLTGGTGTQGTFTWNADEETVDLALDGATLQLGQEVHYHVRNNTASAIPNGTPVYASGTLGASGRITVAPFIADGTIPVKFFIGITTEEIAAGADGKVTDFGKVRNLDTSVFNDGDVLYPSSTVAGGLTNVAPAAPALAIPCAFVVYSGNNGNIFVRVHPQDENAYATYAQGTLADSAVQPGDNVSDLTNDAGYATTTYVDTADTTVYNAAIDDATALAIALG